MITEDNYLYPIVWFSDFSRLLNKWLRKAWNWEIKLLVSAVPSYVVWHWLTLQEYEVKFSFILFRLLVLTDLCEFHKGESETNCKSRDSNHWKIYEKIVTHPWNFSYVCQWFMSLDPLIWSYFFDLLSVYAFLCTFSLVVTTFPVIVLLHTAKVQTHN